MFVLDTNVISELRRPGKANAHVARWADSVPAAQFFLSAVTVLELERGVRQMERKDATQGHLLRRWMDDQILPRFDARILAVDTAVALKCAALHVPDPKSERDALIAATALVHGMTVATRNVQDFSGMGVSLVNPWEARAQTVQG
ncbi:MAG: type II toxin-antitoxin system VapC family toxin [Proteobacteria bacterium]|nr:type II toxin-antitoxin system VapC family toxin [Pseudomonadota bacterium]